MTTPSGTTSDVAAQRSAAGPAKPRRRRTVAKTLLALFALLLIAAALFLFWPLHQRSVPAAANDKPVDVVLVGGGIMSITLATFLQELQPDWNIQI